MRDYANPTLLLIVVGLFAWGLTYSAESGAATGVWAMGLCTTAFIVNGALCLARMVTHRPALMSAVWCAVFLILTACAWVMFSAADDDIYAEERAAYNNRLREWKELGQYPFTSPQQEQECLLVLAAGLGKHRVLRELLDSPEVAQHSDVLQQAAMTAAGNGQTKALYLLLNAGVDANTTFHGTSLICAATIHGNLDTVKLLLQRAANPNIGDTEGISPIMHAVINEDIRMVRMLMQHGANPAQKAADGRDAHSCSKSEEMDTALQGK